LRLQLIAKTNDPELLSKSMHELGTVFYVTDEKGNIVKVVYFSGFRLVEYTGAVDENFAKRLQVEGHKVNLIEVDEIQGYVKIVQGSEN
jgi:hypothetical protein